MDWTLSLYSNLRDRGYCSVASSIAVQCNSGDRSRISCHTQLDSSSTQHLPGVSLQAVPQDEVLVPRCSNLSQNGGSLQAVYCHIDCLSRRGSSPRHTLLLRRHALYRTTEWSPDAALLCLMSINPVPVCLSSGQTCSFSINMNVNGHAHA